LLVTPNSSVSPSRALAPPTFPSVQLETRARGSPTLCRFVSKRIYPLISISRFTFSSRTSAELHSPPCQREVLSRSPSLMAPAPLPLPPASLPRSRSSSYCIMTLNSLPLQAERWIGYLAPRYSPRASLSFEISSAKPYSPVRRFPSPRHAELQKPVLPRSLRNRSVLHQWTVLLSVFLLFH